MAKLILVLLILLNSFGYADEVVTLPELHKPKYIAAAEKFLYIGEVKAVYIYSLIDFKLIKKIEGKGNGQGKLKTISGIFYGNNSLYTAHLKRINRFSETGVFQKMLNTSGFVPFFNLAGDKFLGEAIESGEEGDFDVISLYGSSLKKEKELYRGPIFPKEGVSFAGINRTFFACDSKIFINGEDIIECFDQHGKKLRTIKLASMIKKIEFTEEDKKRYLDHYINKKSVFYEMNKDRFVAPKYYPAIQYFHLADKQLYLITYVKKGSNHECLVLDLDGKLQKRIVLPIVFSSLTDWYPFTIQKGKFYQVVKKPVKINESGTWELRIINI
ncbi:MAG: hypothetical protein GY757_06090 [bacterium]|nr:hypothetical protein [bacterium]